jgi:hypothetical protein
MRERWLGATGRKVPEIAVEGEDLAIPDEEHVTVEGETYDALVLAESTDLVRMQAAHREGTPVIVRAATAPAVKEALARPEVACAAVPAEARELRELDLTALTYE